MSWDKCKKQVDKGNKYKGFMVRRDAETWFNLPHEDPDDKETVPENEELDVRFGDLNVGDYLTVASEESNGSGSNATDLLPSDLDVVPKVDSTELVMMKDLEHLLFCTCAQLQVGHLMFFLRDSIRVQGKSYFGFGVSLQSTGDGVNFFIYGRLSTDQRLSRQDAAFITLERLLEETGRKIFYFNYLVARRYKEQVVELQRVSRMSMPDRVAELEKENAELKQRLGLYNAMFRY